LKPRDPVSENMNILNSKPVRAFIYQDHQAHITVHTTAMQDPKVAQLVGQSPQAQTIAAAAQAHIAEHLAFEYRRQIEESLGVPYPEPDAEIPEEIEVQLSRLAAAGAQKVLAKSQAEAAQQQAQQMAQDPLVQMKQQELQIKAQDVQMKQAKLAIDSAAKADELEVRREQIAAQERIAGMQVGAKIATDKTAADDKKQLEGVRMGIEIAKETSKQAANERAAQRQMQSQQRAPKGTPTEGNR